MANFLFIYRGGGDDYATMTPQEIEENMKQWTDWITEGLQKGWMLDAGDALTMEGRMVNSQKVVTDGPFVEAKEVIGGYAIFELPGKQEAVAMAVEFMQLHKDFMPGWEGTCELRAFAGS